jgi:hypothetical protein
MSLGSMFPSWWLVDNLSRMLDASEREAVRGDLMESGESAGPAAWNVLGLVMRRQIVLWKGWQPWLALVCFVVPLGMLISLVCLDVWQTGMPPMFGFMPIIGTGTSLGTPVLSRFS